MDNLRNLVFLSTDLIKTVITSPTLKNVLILFTKFVEISLICNNPIYPPSNDKKAPYFLILVTMPFAMSFSL